MAVYKRYPWTRGKKLKKHFGASGKPSLCGKICYFPYDQITDIDCKQCLKIYGQKESKANVNG